MSGPAGLPTEPRAVYCGDVMSSEFTGGASLMHDALREWEEAGGDFDEHAFARAIAHRVKECISQPGDGGRGALAALAHWIALVMGGGVPDLRCWRPLEVLPVFDDEGREQPPPHSVYFDVAGEPVSVSPDLMALRWGGGVVPQWREFAVDVVGLVGTPISRRKFDRMRAAVGA